MREPSLRIMPFTRAIRPTMALGAIHLSEQGRLEATDISGDATHGQERVETSV